LTTDNKGKKIKIGSVVAVQRPGRDNYTQQGQVLDIQGDVVKLLDKRTGGITYAQLAKIKRISYNMKKSKRGSFDG
jgi:hypothetical protein